MPVLVRKVMVRHVVTGSLLLLVASCASNAPRPGSGPSRVIAAGVTAPVAPLLAALPDGATFAWVPPEELLGSLKPADVQSVDLGSVRLLRSDLTTLVRSRAWKETSPEEAAFLLTFVQIHRPGARAAAPTPPSGVRGEGIPPCRGMQGESKGITCRAVSASEADGSNRAVAWMTMVIRRRADGAQFTRVLPLHGDMTIEPRAFVEPTLRLFLVEPQAAAPHVTTGSVRPLVGGVTVPIGPALNALPNNARFAWVRPATLVHGMTPLDEHNSRAADVLSLAADVTTVLRSHGWREAPPDSAAYLLTVAYIDRGARSQVGSRFARRSVELPNCRPFGGETRRVNCTSTPISSDPEHRGGVWYAYVIIRRGDSAMRAWAFPTDWDAKATDHGFVRPTLELLLAHAQ